MTPKLDALPAYQLSLETPAPPAGSYDVAAAERGKMWFNRAATCATCQVGEKLTEVNAAILHAT